MKDKLFLNYWFIYIIGFILAAAFIYYFNRKEKKGVGIHTALIQIDLNKTLAITKIREAITPLINNIIEEETNSKNDFPNFLTPKNDIQLVTIYYIIDLKEDGESWVIDAEDRMPSPEFPIKFALSNNFAFFGEKQNELVVLINDTEGKLKRLNNSFKEALHLENKLYRGKSETDLYDIKKSEIFEYVPHIALGRLQSDSIKALFDNEQRGQEVLDKIKLRIQNEVFPVISKLIEENNDQFSVDSFCLYDKDRKCIKKFTKN